MPGTDNAKPPTEEWTAPYGEEPSLTYLAIDAIEAILKAKYEEKKRPLPSPEQITSMAKFLRKRSLKNGHPAELG